MRVLMSDERVVTLDLHVHSKHSWDSWMEPEKIIDAARSAGLDGVAVVDHGSLEGGLETAACAPEGFIAIPGMEVRTELGDVVGLFLSEPIRSVKAAEVIDEIHAQKGVAVLPHPARTGRAYPEEILRALDAIEVHNARGSTLRVFSGKYGEDAVRRFADEYRLALLGASDGHFYREIGRGVTEVSLAESGSVKSAILEGRTAARGGSTSWTLRFLSCLLGAGRRMSASRSY
jgi:predicted metal-dependent phosphoesterase TrpH